jgi:hypothetical protein
LIAAFALTLLLLSFQSKYYDVPTAFFFTAILWCWMTGRYALCIPLFALSSLNRETTVLLMFAFVWMHYGRRDTILLVPCAPSLQRVGGRGVGAR